MLQFPAAVEPIWQLVVRAFSFFVGGAVLYALGSACYNLFFHPLRAYPGPILYRASSWPVSYHTFKGTIHKATAEAHAKYGPRVRLAPNEISFVESQAIKDIYAHTPGKEEFPKQHFALPPNGIPSILEANKENHARYRRLLAHAFSEKGMRDQESHITHYVNLLMERLEERANAGDCTDMVAWYNMTVFDVIGDLAWGESFNSLQSGQMHDWIPAVAGTTTSVAKLTILSRNGLSFLSRYLIPQETHALRERNFRYSQEKVDQRVADGGGRGDFWDRVMIKSANDNEGGEGMSKGEMLVNASVLVLGGSETSATTLSGATYLLLNNPTVMQKLLREVRSTFRTAEEITLFSVNHLKYTSAVLEEAMRLYAPVPRQRPRTVPTGGAMVAGNFLPEGTVCSTPQYTAQRMESNFHRAKEFVPERWLEEGKEEFANDDKAAFFPFSMGTRNCIGRNLAYAEMRLILAKVLWHFDLELDKQKTGDWFDQKVWGVWSKPPLMVKVSKALH